MAKTPLFNRLLRLFYERKAGLSRRDFLVGSSLMTLGAGACTDDEFTFVPPDTPSGAGGSGGAGAGGAGAGGAAGTGGEGGSAGQSGQGGEGGGGPGKDAKVVIVGAGLAGLHCAVRLGELGVEATVYEGSKRAGGRIFSERTIFPDGMSCELGGELIDTGHITMIDLCKEFSLDLLDYQTDDAALRKSWPYFDGKTLTDQEVLAAFEPIAAEIDKALATLTDQEDLWVYHDKPNGGEALDAMSLGQWLDKINATGPIRKLLEVAYLIEFGLEVDETNALNMLFLISTELEKFEIFGVSDERFRVAKGNDALTDALAAKLSPGQLVFEHRLTALKLLEDKRYQLTFDKGGSVVQVEADRVVLALPFTTLREVQIDAPLSEPKKKAIAELGYGTNAKLMVGFSSRVWRDKGSNGETFVDLAYQSSWETSRLQPGPSGIITNFTGGDQGVAVGNGTPESQRDAFVDEFDKVFPGVKAASNGKVARMHWPTVPLAKGSYAAYRVGQYTQLCGAEGLPEEGIFFCGEHTSLEAQGYMEGAAESGARAAVEVAEALGLQVAQMKLLSASMALPSSREGSPSQRILARALLQKRHRRYVAALRRMKRR
ncbi:MAG: FAD-dependent oxidoreductase [Polyangiaceae bacterium]|jgi:monoamine oxidase|nr:FAD-dependent oxidoreductase [Polyangiaceae bacterium]